LTIPQGVPTGCYVPVAVVAGTIVSNIVTLPIATGGGVCSDVRTGINGGQISQALGQTTVNSGIVAISQAATGGSGNVFASFNETAGASYGGVVSAGGCSLGQSMPGAVGGASTPLDAGSITVTGPSGGATVVAESSVGLYSVALPASAIPSTGGVFTFNGSGGAQIGAFRATVSFPNPPLSWTNQGVASTITRAQGLTVNWSGGDPGTFVNITGGSSNGTVMGSYSCIAPVAAGTFTVPSYILGGLPAGSGGTNVVNSTGFSPFMATGLDFGSAYGIVSYSVNSTYN